jgi:ribosomal subunit interface protein
MEITVSGRRMEVSEKLRSLSEQKLGRLDRFLDMERAEVHFTKHRNPRIAESEICEVTLEGHGHHVRTKAAASDGFAALDKAVDKLEHQLSRLKRKLVRRQRGEVRGTRTAAIAATTPPPASVGGTAVVEAEPTEPEEVLDEPPAGRKIVKAKRFHMTPMTPDDACERMDLLGHGFFFFTSSATGRAAVVYLREDGDVGLIDEAG